MAELLLPDLDLETKVEELAWACRTAETPQELIDESMSRRFGYVCREYWNPCPAERTIDLNVCSYWIDKERMLARMHEVWDWADAQIARMRTILTHMHQKFAEMEVVMRQCEIPKEWREWIGEPSHVLGTTCLISAKNNILTGFSAEKYGRYYRVDLHDLCEHDLYTRVFLRPGKSIQRCTKCTYRKIFETNGDD